MLQFTKILIFMLTFFWGGGHYYLNCLRVSWNLIFSKLIILLKRTVIIRDLETSCWPGTFSLRDSGILHNCLLGTWGGSVDLHHWKIYLRIFSKNELVSTLEAQAYQYFGTAEIPVPVLQHKLWSCPAWPTSAGIFFKGTGMRSLTACQAGTQQQTFTWAHQAGEEDTLSLYCLKT